MKKLDNPHQEIVDKAHRLLNRPEVRKMVDDERNHIERIVQRTFTQGDPIYDQLGHILEEARDQLVRPLVSMHPELKVLLPRHENNLVRQWAAAYIKHTACDFKSYKSLAKKYARALVLDIISQDITYREITPLFDFSADEEFSFSRKYPEGIVKFQFRRYVDQPHPLAFGFFYAPDPMDHIPRNIYEMRSHKPTNWVLVSERSVRRKNTFLGDGPWPMGRYPHHVVTALRLFKDQDFEVIETYVSSNTLMMAGSKTMSAWAHHYPPPGAKYTMSSADIESFKTFWKKLSKFLPFDDTLPSTIAMAIRYFESGSIKPLHDRFIDLCIAQEALFAISSENTYRLPIRVSTFLHGHTDSALKVYGQLREVWKLRNQMAHGNFNVKDEKHYKSLQALTPRLRTIVRQSINKHVELFGSLRKDKERYKEYMGPNFEKSYVIR